MRQQKIKIADGVRFAECMCSIETNRADEYRQSLRDGNIPKVICKRNIEESDRKAALYKATAEWLNDLIRLRGEDDD